MRRSSRLKSLVTIIATSLVLSPFAAANRLTAQETRARQTDDRTRPAWPATSAASVQQSTQLGTEPTVRIGLATDMRSVAISTTGHLMNASAENAAPVALETSRVRIESRLLSPATVNQRELYRVELAGSFMRDEAERFARQVQDVTGDQPDTVAIIGTNLFRIVAGT